jgi:hypothetical protein
VAWFGIVTPESVFGVVVPSPESGGGVEPVSVGGIDEPSSGTVGVSSWGTVGVVSVPVGLRVVAARCAGAEDGVLAAVEAVPVDVLAALLWCPLGASWRPRSLTLGAGSRAVVSTAAGGLEAAAGWGSPLLDLTSRTTARVTTAPVTKQSRLRRITTFFATIVTRQR